MTVTTGHTGNCFLRNYEFYLTQTVYEYSHWMVLYKIDWLILNLRWPPPHCIVLNWTLWKNVYNYFSRKVQIWLTVYKVILWPLAKFLNKFLYGSGIQDDRHLRTKFNIVIVWERYLEILLLCQLKANRQEFSSKNVSFCTKLKFKMVTSQQDLV